MSFPEKLIMNEESINDRTKVIGEILSTKFEEIENRALGNTCDSGIPVSFYDYDAMTQGLPRGINCSGWKTCNGQNIIVFKYGIECC